MSSFQYHLASVICRYEKSGSYEEVGIPLSNLVNQHQAGVEFDEVESLSEDLESETEEGDTLDMDSAESFNPAALKKEFWATPDVEDWAGDILLQESLKVKPLSPPERQRTESETVTMRMLHCYHVYLARQKEARSAGKNLKCQHCDLRLDRQLQHQRETCRLVCRAGLVLTAAFLAILQPCVDSVTVKFVLILEYLTKNSRPFLDGIGLLVRFGWFGLSLWVLTKNSCPFLDGIGLLVRFGWFGLSLWVLTKNSRPFLDGIGLLVRFGWFGLSLWVLTKNSCPFLDGIGLLVRIGWFGYVVGVCLVIGVC
ncbi:hypothetical protein BDR26DRAFT_935842 [Obelidium mucronatum]|nr:hypothetical protein BDR26DRAFT_935842 [Obelidium mucronatum]